MRTFIGFAILAVAGLAGYFLLPRALSSGASGSLALDKAAADAANAGNRYVGAALDATAVAVDIGAEVVDEAADVPYWAWIVPGGQLVYAAQQEAQEEIREWLTGAGED